MRKWTFADFHSETRRKINFGGSNLKVLETLKLLLPTHLKSEKVKCNIHFELRSSLTAQLHLPAVWNEVNVQWFISNIIFKKTRFITMKQRYKTIKVVLERLHIRLTIVIKNGAQAWLFETKSSNSRIQKNKMVHNLNDTKGKKQFRYNPRPDESPSWRCMKSKKSFELEP